MFLCATPISPNIWILTWAISWAVRGEEGDKDWCFGNLPALRCWLIFGEAERRLFKIKTFSSGPTDEHIWRHCNDVIMATMLFLQH